MMAQKSVLITGASKGGIGDALAQEFHRNGLLVFATARSLSKLEHLKDLGLETLELDITSEESIKRAVAIVGEKTGGRLDFLVNNAGAGYTTPILDTDPQAIAEHFNLNVFSLIAVTKAFFPLLATAHGTILNNGSVSGEFPQPWQGIYNSAKAAVRMLNDVLRLELMPFNISVILILSAGTKTHFFDNLPNTPVLAEGSLYQAGKQEIEPFLNGTAWQNDLMEVNIYAKKVVSNALKRNPKKYFWVGGGSWTVWFLRAFGWSTVWDWVVPNLYKFPALIRKMNAKQDKVTVS